jgi:D-aspartate ligase
MATPLNDLRLGTPDPSRPPVLLLGGINLARTLGLAGIAVVVASPDPDDPVFASRYCKGRFILPRYEDAQAAVDAIVALGDRLRDACGRRVPLMYGSDDALELIHAHRERLQRHFLLLLNEPGIGEALIAKDRFKELARARALPVPRDLAWEGHGAGSVAGAPGAVIVKPSTKVDWHASQLRERLFGGEAKARVFASGALAAADPAVRLFHDQLTFQEYVHGDDACLWSFHGVADATGKVVASFVGRKIRTHPPQTGESAFIEMAGDARLHQLGTETAARIPLRGPFKMDFKRDARDGRWYLLEVNARYNLWHYLGARNGINLMRAAYELMLEGACNVPLAPPPTHRWLSLELDWRSYRALAARGELSFPRWLASIACCRKVYNVFAWSDPGPWLRFWSARVRRRVQRGPARMLALVRQWRSTAS